MGDPPLWVHVGTLQRAAWAVELLNSPTTTLPHFKIRILKYLSRTKLLAGQATGTLYGLRVPATIPFSHSTVVTATK